MALTQAKRANAPGAAHDRLIEQGLNWLADHVNADGGSGDTVFSRSNPSTTTLAWATFDVGPDATTKYHSTLAAAETWLLVRVLSSPVTGRAFRVLDSIQPPNGGFLEAIPLTAATRCKGQGGTRRKGCQAV